MGPSTGPTGVANVEYSRDRSRAWVLPTVVAVAAALVLSAIGVVIGLLVNQQSEHAVPPATATGYPSPTNPAPESTSEEAPSASTSTETTAPENSEAGSAQRLQELAASDRPYVGEVLADRLVPRTQFQATRSIRRGPHLGQHGDAARAPSTPPPLPGVRLLWSGDWSTSPGSNFWVTIVGITFPDSSGALAWCRDRGFDSDHCAAKVVSISMPAEGSTAYN